MYIRGRLACLQASACEFTCDLNEATLVYKTLYKAIRSLYNNTSARLSDKHYCGSAETDWMGPIWLLGYKMVSKFTKDQFSKWSEFVFYFFKINFFSCRHWNFNVNFMHHLSWLKHGASLYIKGKETALCWFQLITNSQINNGRERDYSLLDL